MESKERNIAISIILTIVTCGIYGIYWFIMLSDEVKSASDDDSMPSGGIAFLLTLVTCGIYGIYWAYRMGKALETARERAGLTATDNSVLYLILQIFGFGIINYALMQNELNTIASEGEEHHAEHHDNDNDEQDHTEHTEQDEE